MTSKFYSRLSIVAILVLVLLSVALPVSANTTYLPIVAAGDDGLSEPEDISNSDGTCLFWRNGNNIYLSIYVTIGGKDLYVVSSTEREDEPYVIPFSPRTVQVGEVDGNGESVVGYTWEGFTKQIRCDAQFVYQP